MVNILGPLTSDSLVKPKESRNGTHASHKLYSLLRNRSFRAFILCGIAGVSIDIDHPISFLAKSGLHARFLHLPIFIGACVMFCGICAYLGGLLFKMVLKHRPGIVSIKK